MPEFTTQAALMRLVTPVLDAGNKAHAEGNLKELTDMMDFPVLMVTDDSKHEAMASIWNENQYLDLLAAEEKELPPQAIEGLKNAKLLRDYTFITESIVTVEQTESASWDGTVHQYRSFALLIKRNGRWLVKAQAW